MIVANTAGEPGLRYWSNHSSLGEYDLLAGRAQKNPGWQMAGHFQKELRPRNLATGQRKGAAEGMVEPYVLAGGVVSQ